MAGSPPGVSISEPLAKESHSASPGMYEEERLQKWTMELKRRSAAERRKRNIAEAKYERMIIARKQELNGFPAQRLGLQSPESCIASH